MVGVEIRSLPMVSLARSYSGLAAGWEMKASLDVCMDRCGYSSTDHIWVWEEVFATLTRESILLS